MRFQMKYMDLTEWFPSIGAAHSPSNTYVQATVLTENPTVSVFVVETTDVQRARIRLAV
jgi:hypothetical protein